MSTLTPKKQKNLIKRCIILTNTHIKNDINIFMKTPTHWLQLHFSVPQNQVDELVDALEASGSLAIDLASATSEEILEPLPETTPLWRETSVTALFLATTDINNVIAQLQPMLSFALPKPVITKLEEQNWILSMQRDFVPMHFGNNLWVYASWNEPPTDPAATTILLDPGMAFGTGTHPTTALCLEWLAQHPLQQQSVIDYGCGSGILAIAAAKLGAQRVWATDIDAQALQATMNNADSNQVTKQLTITSPDTPPSWLADIIIANIILRPLIDLAPTFAQRLKPQGLVVFSGVLERQIAELTQAYQSHFEIIKQTIKEGWGCITARKL